MVTTIDILSNFPKPKPALPKSRRGTLTFIANIEERGRPTVKRNLTRGVEETDDPYRPPYIGPSCKNRSFDSESRSLQDFHCGRRWRRSSNAVNS